MKTERRKGEIRADEESRQVEGYALVFDTPSDRMPYTEIIKRGSLDGVIGKSDVLVPLNHDTGRGILARAIKGVGSCKLHVDERGLKYSFEAPKTALGDELLEYLKRGDITESSFAFTVKEDELKRDTEGNITRTIVKFDELFDVSPVYRAAYSATNVYARSVDDMKKELDELEERKKKEENKEVVPEAYYTELEKEFN